MARRKYSKEAEDQLDLLLVQTGAIAIQLGNFDFDLTDEPLPNESISLIKDMIRLNEKQIFDAQRGIMYSYLTQIPQAEYEHRIGKRKVIRRYLEKKLDALNPETE